MRVSFISSIGTRTYYFYCTKPVLKRHPPICQIARRSILEVEKNGLELISEEIFVNKSAFMHEIKVIGLLIAHENKVIACGQILRPGILASSCEVYGGFVGTREFVCTWKRPDLGRVQRIYAHLAFLLHRSKSSFRVAADEPRPPANPLHHHAKTGATAYCGGPCVTSSFISLLSS